MVEISRVLKPGGIFVASTFLKTFSPLGEFLGDDVVRPLNQVHITRYQSLWLDVPTLLDILLSVVAAIQYAKLTLQMVGGAGATGADHKHGFAEFSEASNQPLYHVCCSKAP